jgi:hypothetical protein
MSDGISQGYEAEDEERREKAKARKIRKEIIYLASSWRNPEQSAVLAKLRALPIVGSVYDFKNPAPGNTGFGWSQVDPNWKTGQKATRPGVSPADMIRLLNHPVAQAGFRHDSRAMAECSSLVLLLESGKSAHMEFGFVAGIAFALRSISGLVSMGRIPRTFVLMDGAALYEPELIYLLAGLTPDGEDVDASKIIAPSFERLTELLNG